ncbi:MAG: metallophosphoesterase [Gammaproteobacteria bacterium]|nr:metallophosphoesterase [Gammaproteobacteria bacterium]
MLVVCSCSHVKPYLQTDTPSSIPDAALRARVILVGDAGRPHAGVLEGVGEWSTKFADKTAVVFLGDNVYEHGLPAGPAKTEKAALDRQIASVSSLHGLFIPGNHDWRAGRKGISRQMTYVERSSKIRFLPRDGCPGPSSYTPLDGILIIAVDTQWFLQESADAAGCDLGEDPILEFSARVQRLLRSAEDRLVVVVAHHPPWTYGPHGGFYDWRDHLFPLTRLVSWAWIPLPAIGSLYPIARTLRKHSQDAFSPPYRKVQRQLADAFAVFDGRGPLIFAGGHDHSLQVIENRKPWGYVLVSGSGSTGKLTTVTHGHDTVFAFLAHGFMSIDLMDNGSAYLHVIVAGQPDTVFIHTLRADPAR